MSTSKRRNDIKILLFALLLAAPLYFALQYAIVNVCRIIVENSEFRIPYITRGTIDTDVLLLGNSRGLSLMNGTTDARRPSVFNLSYNGLRRRSIFALAQEFFGHGNKARVVVVAASSTWYYEPNCELKPFWTELPYLFQATSARCGRDAWLARYFPLTAYDTEPFLRSGYFAFFKRRREQAPWTNNQMSTSACARSQSTTMPVSAMNARYKIAALQNSILEFRQWLSDKYPTVKVVFVLEPYLVTPSTKSDIQALRTLAHTAIGNDLIDLSTALGDDCSSFADPLHLNQRGRDRIGGILVSQISKRL